MDDRAWTQIRYFSKDENWGDLDLLQLELVTRLDWFREHLGVPIHINCAADLTGHQQGSYHYQGMAADIHCFGKVALADFALAAIKMGFNGVGVYPNWNTPGIHVDVRPSVPGKPMASWVCHRKGSYKALDMNELSFIHCRAQRNQCLLLVENDEVTEPTHKGGEA